MASHSGKSRCPRSTNWTSDEKAYLINLISESIDIVESKRNDHETITRKSKAWEEISKKFHARYGRQGGSKVCSDQWKRLKQIAKSEWSKYKHETMKTGGGQVEKQFSFFTLIVRDLIPNEFLQIRNAYDDDQEITEQNNEAVTALEYLGLGGRASLSASPSKVISDTDDRPVTTSTTDVPDLQQNDQGHSQEFDITLPSSEDNIDFTRQRQDRDHVAEQHTATPSLPQPSYSGTQTTTICSSASTSTNNKALPSPWTRSKRQRRERTPSPSPRSTQTLEEVLKDLALQEHKTKIEHMEMEHALKLEILEIEKKVQLKRLELLNSTS